MILSLRSKPRRVSTLARFRTDPIGFLNEIVSDDRPTAEFRIGRQTLTLVKDAPQIEEVLVKKQDAFRKGPGLLRLRRLLGEGLLTVDTARHLNDRRKLQASFSVPKIAEYSKQFGPIFDTLTEDWKPGETRDMQAEMARITLAVISLTAFSSSTIPDHVAVGKAINSGLDQVFLRLSKCPHGKDSSSEPHALLDTVLDSVYAGHTPASDGLDLVSLLSASGFDDELKKNQALTFLLGGHESVGVSLTWTWYVLSQHPQIRELFEAEIDSAGPDVVDPRELPFTRQIIAESLRYYPPAWLFSRQAIEDVTIGGIDYPKGAVLVVAPIVTHRDPRYWDEPERFNPARWDTAKYTMTARERFSYFPFGGGARRCIGEQFALNELPLALAAIGRKWRLDMPADAAVPQYDPVVTLRTLGGLPMELAQRCPAR